MTLGNNIIKNVCDICGGKMNELLLGEIKGKLSGQT